ncbi:tigger transposable element-derived protein 4-like [Sipha flava]|uniref:Tigger transposable element-derived protein 4-like n=1 Tax=Sipha flava TaxID=143950 RepID=A0A8B8G5P6_9HEMI|nr:tigger transposable element-derived protein 4-like [Sipha flava]
MSTKRNDLTIKEKKDILVRFDKLDKCSQREATLALKIPQPTLNKILKNRKEIVEHEEQNLPLSRKRKRNGQNVDVEESLLRWFQQARNLNVPGLRLMDVKNKSKDLRFCWFATCQVRIKDVL